MTDYRKVIVNLPVSQIDFIQRVAKKDDVSFVDVLRRAINCEAHDSSFSG